MKVFVTDRDGSERTIDADEGEKLMIALVENDYEIEAICGGVANCATCHVYVDEGWVDRLSEPGTDEWELLQSSAYARPNSRLSCQIKLDDSLEGLQVTVAPEE